MKQHSCCGCMCYEVGKHSYCFIILSIPSCTTWFAVKGAPATSACQWAQALLLIFIKLCMATQYTTVYIKQLWSKINNAEVASFIWYLSPSFSPPFPAKEESTPCRPFSFLESWIREQDYRPPYLFCPAKLVSNNLFIWFPLSLFPFPFLFF